MKVLFVALFLSFAGYAEAGTEVMGFSELREACQDPAKFQNQIAPRDIKVTCEDRATKWKSVRGSTVDLERTREIISSFTSDKYDSSPFTETLDVEKQTARCPKFKEMLEVLTFTKATTCDEILEFKGTETEYCADILDKVRESNPKSIEISETGKVVDLCEADPVPEDSCDRGQRGQRGQNNDDSCKN